MTAKLLSLIFILSSATAVSAGSSITCYSDGSVVAREAVGVKGIVEIPLLAGLLDGTLKITPAAGTAILNVEVTPAKIDARSAKEIETLAEQRQRLEDRLQALATREEIFRAAAKSQSARTPRKSKSNPDPMSTIRQGTDFAIAQLETVYSSRRKTGQEIKRIDARIASVRKNAKVGVSSARITITPERGRVTASYATSELGWKPHYDMHLAGDGFAALQFSARITGNFGGYLFRVSPGSITEIATAQTFPAAKEGMVRLAAYRLPVSEERHEEGIYNRFSGQITNSSGQHLPPGETELYRNGAYLGKFRFEGMSSGRSRSISFGK